MIRKHFRRVLAAAFVLGLATLAPLHLLHAQAVANASVTGRITDSQGANIPGVSVTMISVDTGMAHKVQTNADGIYTLPNLPVGPYRLEASSAGFEKYVQSGIVLRVNDNVEVNVVMTVGSATETIQVEANATMVQTQQNNVSQVIDQRRIVELPLNGRDPTQLITLSGAAVNHSDGTNTGSKSFVTAQSIAVAGGAGDQTNYLLDGGDNNDSFTNVNLPFPFPDALQEFSVETNSLPARNGLHPGGLVNAITKSGSNQWHGSAFEFLRNYDLNAINYFASRQDSLKRNQYGGTFGGKILTDKLFFFGGYQGSLIRQDPSSTSAYVPTPAALAGDFSALDGAACQSNHTARTIKDPATGKVLSNDYIDPHRFDPASVKLASYLPVPTNSCGLIYFGVPVHSNESQYISRVDWTISPVHSFYGRYMYDDYELASYFSTSNILVTDTPGNSQRAQTLTLGDTYSLASTLVNSLHFTFSRRRINRGSSQQDISATTLGVQNVYQGTPTYLQVSVNNGGFTVGNSSGGALGIFNVNSFQEADDVDWMHGKHQVALGVDAIRTEDNVNSHYEDNGWFQFSNIYSNDPMLDFLMGYMNQYQQTMPQQIAYRQTVFSAYVQDTFHATPKLVINAGVRWEPLLFPQDYFARGSTFNSANFTSGTVSSVFTNAPAGLLFYGDKGVPRGFTKDSIADFSPRLGLVYNPDGSGKTTIRAGGALLYDTLGTYLTYRVTANNLPYGLTITNSSGPYPFSNPWTNVPGGNPFPLPFSPAKNFSFPLSGSVVFLPSQLKPVNVAQWTLGVQHQLSDNWALSISYLGSKTSHMMIGNEVNPAVYIPGTWSGPGSCGALTISPGNGKPCSSTSNTQSRRALNLANPVIGQYYGTQVVANDGINSNYNGMLASIEHRFARNYTVLANYTWSKCLGVQPIISLGTEGVIQNPYNPRSDYGPCTYDATNILNITGVVASNFIHGGGKIQRVLNGWQIAPLFRYQTGLPFSAATGSDNSLTGIGVDRPNATGQDPYAHVSRTSKSFIQYLSSGAYVANPLGTFGNAGHDGLRSPDYVDMDSAISRIFNVHESLNLTARFEAFNVLNHPNFNAPNATLSAASFGQITSAQDPRILQAALKLTF